jgi:hypothetical protein
VGLVLAGICLVAEWLDLSSTPLGLAGSVRLQSLGFPTDRFIGLGAILVGTNTIATSSIAQPLTPNK